MSDPTTPVPAWRRSVAAALRPGAERLAVAAAVRTVVAAGAIALLATAVGDLRALSVAYLGATWSVVFVRRGTYRSQAAALLAQALGAVVGIAAGSLGPPSAAGLVAVAALAGVVSGILGGIGPSTPPFGMMLSVGVAFAQFDGSSLPWWQQASWYLVGAGTVGVATLGTWPWRRGVREREAAAEVLAAAADLGAAIGTPGARIARDRLAGAFARARAATQHVRAELVAFAVAGLYARGQRPPAGVVVALRTAADQVRHGDPVAVRLEVDTGDDDLRALADALGERPSRPGAPPPGSRLRAAGAVVVSRTALLAGARMGLCLGVATALTVALHEPDHSFWLPLTVAVILRPEYASVFVRTLNRVVGTVVGAVLAAAVLAAVSGAGAGAGPAIALTSAVALGGAVLTAPRLYAWSVVGVTASVLLAASLGGPDPVLPALRLLDTLVGALVAVVVGYLVWPGARRSPAGIRLRSAVDAARRYAAVAAEESRDPVHHAQVRDEAYRLAHRARADAEAALLEPPPVSTRAAPIVVRATELEDTVDMITAVAAAVDAGARPSALVAQVARRLEVLDSPVPVVASDAHQAQT